VLDSKIPATTGDLRRIPESLLTIVAIRARSSQQGWLAAAISLCLLPTEVLACGVAGAPSWLYEVSGGLTRLDPCFHKVPRERTKSLVLRAVLVNSWRRAGQIVFFTKSLHSQNTGLARVVNSASVGIWLLRWRRFMF
jgi:hypothetical protein